MLAAFVGLALLVTQDTLPDGRPILGKEFYLGDPAKPTTRAYYFESNERLDPPKTSPKLFGDPAQPLMFEWQVIGFGRSTGLNDEPYYPKFRVFSQERKAENDKALAVCRMLLRLWDFNMQYLQLDHNRDFYRGMVDFYLCWSGQPGGEHLFGESREGGQMVKVNTVYIYDLNSFTDPVEMAREVAHEYGHASLYPIGGFVTPEDWANGYLGEKLYLRHLRNRLKNGQLHPNDAMGATHEQLDAWVKKNVDPLVLNMATKGPELFNLLDGPGKASMDAFLGLALYVEEVFPAETFRRTMKLTNQPSPKNMPQAIVLAAEEKQRITLNLSPQLLAKPFWVPLGKGKVQNAQIVKKSGDWALVKAQTGAVTLVYPAN